MDFTITEAVSTMGWVVAVITLLLNLYSRKKIDEDDAAQAAAQMMKLSIKIDSLASSNDQILRDITRFRDDNAATREKLALVEASVKSAHNRLDDMIAGKVKYGSDRNGN